MVSLFGPGTVNVLYLYNINIDNPPIFESTNVAFLASLDLVTAQMALSGVLSFAKLTLELEFLLLLRSRGRIVTVLFRYRITGLFTTKRQVVLVLGYFRS